MKMQMRRLCSLLCVLALVLGLLPSAALAADSSGNLLENPGFEENNLNGWDKGTGKCGIQTNNPHDGQYGFFLNPGESCWIAQAVTMPYSGWYHASAYISTGGADSKFGLRTKDGNILAEAILPNGATYTAAHELQPIELKQGDVVELYCIGGKSWTNGDDFLFSYDFSQVFYNLIPSEPLEADIAVALPWAGDYNFSATVSGDGVTVNGEAVAAGEANLTLEGQAADAQVEIVIPQGCSLSDASLTLDVTSIPNDPPTAEALSVTGLAHSGLNLVGSYTFSDSDDGQAGTEGSSTFRWLSADKADGSYAPIANATTLALLLTDDLANQYVKLEVTPVDGLGLEGDPVLSDAVGPVAINYVRNPSLDLETSQQPTDWSAKNGGAMPNKKEEARTGFRFARIPAGDADAEVFYSFTVPSTARYTAGVWVNTTGSAGSFGIRAKGTGTVLASKELAATEGYQLVEVGDIVIEENAQVEFFIKGGEDCAQIDADDFQLLCQDAEELPEFVTLHAFSVAGQTLCRIDELTHTIKVTVPYGTDVTALETTIHVSDRATVTPASGSTLDFTEPVTFTIVNGATTATWTATCTVADRILVMTSDNKTLEDGFNWAAPKTQQFVMTGQSGFINKAADREGTGPVDYMPSYWAGYYDRTAFYSRDFCHQAVGGQIVGLWDENYSMFHTFAEGCTEARKWYTLWAYNFDGSNYLIDYKSDTNFVREVPAQFELVEKAYKQYLWSGDRHYIEDETMWNFYTKVMTDYVTLHDTNGNGVAEGTGNGIFQGSCTYNERGGQPIIEAGDAIGSQYQATLAYAAMLKERGENAASEEWYAKAAELKRYFNEEWSVMPGDEDGTGPFARALSTDKTTKYDDFGKENSWFMPMKLITEPGERTDAYLDFIMDEVGDHIGDKTNSPRNIEAWSYLPDTFFPYNRANDAWKYMKYILSVKDDPHERPIQGTNGDYPEISYTFLTHTIEGMMGMEADAYNHRVVTAPRLPDEVHEVEVKYIQMGDHTIDLAHNGLTATTLHNDSEHALEWEIRFYGAYQDILVDGVSKRAAQKDVNGVTVSYVTAAVPAGGTVAAEAGTPGQPVAEFDVAVDTLTNGSVVSDKAVAAEGETVTLTVSPASGYVLTSGSLKVNGSAQGIAAGDGNTYTFVMPARDVLITASFESTSTPPTPPSSGSSSNTTTKTEKNGDGSTTKTVTNKKTGSVTETTTYPDGTKIVATTPKDGERTIEVTVPKSKDSVTVTIPTAQKPAPGTVAVIVKSDGTEEIVKSSVSTEDGLRVTLTEGCKLEIVDNTKYFDDVAGDHWAAGAIAFVTSRELFTGTGSDTFTPLADMSRAMLITVLARLDGQDLSGGDTWYSKAAEWAKSEGITDGAELDHSITRESLALMLYRYAGSPEISVMEKSFTDSDDISDWAADAMAWAVNAGIVGGKSGNTLDPKGTATRAEVSAMLQRFISQPVK